MTLHKVCLSHLHHFPLVLYLSLSLFEIVSGHCILIPYCIIRSIRASYDEVLLSLFLAKSFICRCIALITSEHLICNCHALELIDLEHLVGSSGIIASISLYFVHLYAVRSHASRFDLWWHLLKTRFDKPA